MSAWDDTHESLCQRGQFCSAHQPGNWQHLARDLQAMLDEVRGVVAVWDTVGSSSRYESRVIGQHVRELREILGDDDD